MKIAVTGYEGRLGSELIRRGCEPLPCDITLPYTIADGLVAVEPDIVINCAAFTQVDEAETKYDEARKVNTWGVLYLLQEIDKWKSGRVPLIHISTDYVWDGRKGPYKENAKYNEPINAYGFTKWAAEIIIREFSHYPAFIIRTTGLFGSRNCDDLIYYICSSLGNNEKIYMHKGLKGNQTYIPFFVDALLDFIALPNKPKIIHIASSDIMTRYEFALAVASVWGYDKNLVCPTNTPEGWIAKRPTNAGLNIQLAKKLRLPIYSVLDGIKQYYKRANEDW